ncbi:MAG: hypothetical protein M3P27_07975 [Acidobacteriota bacterium]|nr:hypothetical protein [Acidobacteriota bacterium]
MPYNVASRNALVHPVPAKNLKRWFARELRYVKPVAARKLLRHVFTHLDEFVSWPEQAVLLWQGCDRRKPPGKQRYHAFPDPIRAFAKEHHVRLDSRANGPAKAAFAYAGGPRPDRYGSTQGWTVHHLYSGKFPYVGKDATMHAVKHCDHFTQSAGLVAVHPIANAMCDEFPCFSWLLRAEAFRRFGYDPDSVFSKRQDKLGFATTRPCVVFYREKT